MMVATDAVSSAAETSAELLRKRFRAVRSLSLDLVAQLSDADATAQSMPDASPSKWHLAHTTWFFETFILRDHLPGYRLHDEHWAFLFNSYYEAEGARHLRSQRGLLTRPALSEVIDYRHEVDEAIVAAMPLILEHCLDLFVLGLNHEQQHQELLLTDLKHLFFQNPLGPAVWPVPSYEQDHRPGFDISWHEGPVGLVETGHSGTDFAFDCEQPSHRHFLTPYALASRPVTNGEWFDFIRDNGYATATLWLADGWAWVQRENIGSPLYWRRHDRGWEEFTLSGWRPIDRTAPVTHISLYEADAFATWAGRRLPTEQEWEAVARDHDPLRGIQLDRAGPVQPRFVSSGEDLSLFGNVWEWTGSAYRPFPGFRSAPGAAGEYNGKFMSGQFVLRGGSCATPRGHLRASYRNFFYPHQRWQFTGLRLAKDL